MVDSPDVRVGLPEGRFELKSLFRREARLHRVGQRRGGDVEAKVDRARHLVHVLPAGPLSAHRGDLDLGLVDREIQSFEDVPGDLADHLAIIDD